MRTALQILRVLDFLEHEGSNTSYLRCAYHSSLVSLPVYTYFILHYFRPMCVECQFIIIIIFLLLETILSRLRENLVDLTLV